MERLHYAERLAERNVAAAVAAEHEHGPHAQFGADDDRIREALAAAKRFADTGSA